MDTINIFAVQRGLREKGPNYFVEMRDSRGDSLYTRMPIFGRIYYFYHPDQVHALLVEHADKMIKPTLTMRVLKSSFGDGLFTSDGALWKRQRKLMQPTFNHGKIGKYADGIVTHTHQMLEGWHDGDMLQIDKAMHALTLTIIVDALFTTDVSGETAIIAQGMYDLGQAVAAQGRDFALAMMPDWMPHPVMRRKREGVASINRILYRMIQERRSAGEANAPNDLMTALLFTTDAQTGETMSDQQVRDELMTLFIAGHDTTAHLLGWAWTLLAKHPQVEAKLHEELDRVIGRDRAPTLDDLQQLTYTAQIIKETLRLYPPAWLIMREATEPLEVCGERIEAGKMIFLMPYVTHRDGRWFENPSTFIPERWADDYEKQLPKGAYTPFGSGPRVCIGNGFAMMEAQLILAAIAQRYRIELCSEAQMTFDVGTLGFAKPVQVRLHER
jgi:cytochrome P450